MPTFSRLIQVSIETRVKSVAYGYPRGQNELPLRRRLEGQRSNTRHHRCGLRFIMCPTRIRNELVRVIASTLQLKASELLDHRSSIR